MRASRIRLRCLGTAVFLLMAVMAPAALGEPPPAAPNGFLAPTLEGDWRFKVAINAWMPNTVLVDVNGEEKLDIDLIFILKHLDYLLPFDFEVRKGRFGVYLDTLFFDVDGKRDGARHSVKWKDQGYLLDAGVSYEFARFALSEQRSRPDINFELTAGLRRMDQPVEVDLDFKLIGGRGTVTNFSYTVPVVGMRSTLNLDEHWFLRAEGDYGGWGVDRNHETWQGVGLLGYRWGGWGVHWTLEVGYRAMRLFDFHGPVDLEEDARGANAILSVEF